MKRSTDNRRSPAEIKADLYRHYGGLEHSNADMTDFRRPAYSVRHPKDGYADTQNMSTAAALIRAQGEQIRETPRVNRKHSAWIEDAEKYIAGKYRIRGDADGDNKGTAPGVPE